MQKEKDVKEITKGVCMKCHKHTQYAKGLCRSCYNITKAYYVDSGVASWERLAEKGYIVNKSKRMSVEEKKAFFSDWDI